MSQPEHDSLRVLPRVTASRGFTDEVMRRVRREPRASRVHRAPLAMRFAAAAVICAFLVAGFQFVHAELAQRARIASLRNERQQIAAELEAVRELADEGEPVVVLEDGKGTRVIMDLDTELDAPAATTQVHNYD